MSNNEKNITINITTGTFIRAILLVLGIIFLYFVRDVVAIVLFSIVIASGIDPWARWFQKYRIPRVMAIVLIYFLIFAVLGSLFYLIVPTMFSELSDLAAAVPAYLEKPLEPGIIAEFFPALPRSIVGPLQGFAESMRNFINTLTSGESSSANFFHAIAAVFGGAMSFGLMIVFSFYLSVQDKGIENFLRIITPIKQEKYAIDLWRRTRTKIGGWLKGQILLGLLVGVLVYLGLTILQVKYALILALLAAVFELIPVFGPILAAIPAIGVALLQSPILALIVLALFIIIGQFENHLIYPLVVRKIVGVQPIVAILALVIGGKLGGFFGVLLSIPIAAALVEFLGDIEKEKALLHKK